MRTVIKTPLIGLLLVGVIIGLEILIAVLVNSEFKTAFLVVMAMIVVALAWIKIEWLAPAMVFSLFLMGFSLGGFGGGNIRIYHLLTMFLIIRWAYYILITKQDRFFMPSEIFIPIVACMAWATFSLMWTPNLDVAFNRWVKVLLSMAGAIVLVNICKHKGIQRQVIWYWVLCGIVGGIISYYLGIHADPAEGVLPESVVGHLNILSSMMNICMFLALAMAILTRRPLYRVFCILTVICALAVNTTTGSRGGFMGLAAGLIIFVILAIFNSKAGRKFPISLTTVFLIGVALIAWGISRMESLEIVAFGRSFDVLNPMQTDTFAWRVRTYITALEIMKEHIAWIWGMGVGAWDYLQSTYITDPWGRFIHNFYVNYFFQYGLIGMVILMWLFVRVFGQIVKSYTWFKDLRTRWFLNCLVAMYVCTAVHGLVDIEENQPYIWILFATTSLFMDYLKERHDAGLPANSEM